jgi:hypothetical protein
LRRALNAGGEADLLRTVRAEGYALDHKFAGEPLDVTGATHSSGISGG